MPGTLIEIGDLGVLSAHANVLHGTFSNGQCGRPARFDIQKAKPGSHPLDSGKHDTFAISSPRKICDATAIIIEQITKTNLPLTWKKRNSVCHVAYSSAFVSQNCKSRPIWRPAKLADGCWYFR